MIPLYNINQILTDFIPNHWNTALIEFFNILVKLIFYTIMMLIIKRFIERFLSEKITTIIKYNGKISQQRGNTIRSVFQNLAKYVLYFLYAYIILSVLGVPVATLVAGVGVVGIAIGLGAQDLITDMINGFFILFENQYEVGDFVEIHQEGISGNIVDMGIRTTTIKAPSGEVYFIPNSIIKIVNNRSMCHRQINIDMPLVDEYDLDLIEKIVNNTTARINQEYEKIMRGQPIIVGIIRGEGLSFHYRISFLVEQGQEYLHTSTFYGEYYKAFQENKIHLPTSIYQVKKNKVKEMIQ